jgi:predicted lipid carrier protein YhbT
MLSVPVKLAPFALKRQVLEQVLSWQFRQALAGWRAGVSRRPLVKYSCA